MFTATAKNTGIFVLLKLKPFALPVGKRIAAD